jgi:hypothetical protein
MNRTTIIIAAMLICLPTPAQTQAKPADNATAPTITITKLDITDKTLNLSYEIRNTSEQDIWILGGFAESDLSFDVFLDKDGRTLLMQRRFDVPSGGGDVVPGRYVLIRPGDTRTESVTLALPVWPEYGLASGRTAQLASQNLATRLAIEVGYYPSLPEKIRRTLEEADRIGMNPKTDDDRRRFLYLQDSLRFNALNETLSRRDEEILLPYTHQWFKGEQVLRAVGENVRIPYEEKDPYARPRQNSLDSRPCTRLEIQYLPSTLEYFFPYASEQALLNPKERQALRAQNVTVLRDQESLTTFVSNINKGIPTGGGVVRERATAQVICYHDQERQTAFFISNDESVVVNSRDRFTYAEGFLRLNLRKLTPQVEPFELRVRCAANLRNLWHRARLYHKAVGKIEMGYPPPVEWCDAMVRAYEKTVGVLDESPIGAHKCPSTAEGDNHYAMNPNCKPDSSPDMVLLFETKAGWNQHGGPELFTFDNHDPKGGCVLLNDGTVKFIRTKEEIEQLRWK